MFTNLNFWVLVVCFGAIFWALRKLAHTSKFQILGEYFTKVKTEEKIVALTYDDGPEPVNTEKLLDVLNDFQVRATFFVIGSNVVKYPATIKRLIAEGHEVGNHSYSHLPMIGKMPGFIKAEIEKTELLLRQLGAKQAIHFRSPFGFKLFILPYILWRKKIKNILWNIDSKDYAASNSEAIVEKVLAQIEPGAIILLHDGGGDRTLTIEATAKLIPQLQEKGYQLTTISQLIAKG